MTSAGKRAQQSTRLPNRLRIIGGRWRGTKLIFPAISAIRPSPDRVRETVFNWLQGVVVGSRCLDLFAGSGALGLEALSRGAAAAVFVDREPAIGAYLRETLARLHASHGEVHVGDAFRYLSQPARPFDIVFLDPPFGQNLLPRVCRQLQQGWLAAGAYVYLECESSDTVPPVPPEWRLLKSKRAGQVGYHLLQVDHHGSTSVEPES